jgi:hypothetical protein
MAFLHLWSSERISFSLSIMAVISAALTSYYQFFYFETDVTIHFPNKWFIVEEMDQINNPEGIFHSEFVIMNAGTENIGLTNCKIFVTGEDENSIIWQDDSEPKNMPGGLDSLISFEIEDMTYAVVKPGEVHILDLSTNYNFAYTNMIFQSQMKSENFYFNGYTGEVVSSAAEIYFGLWMKFVDSRGFYSTRRCFLGSVAYQMQDSTGFGVPWHYESLSPTYKLEAFKPLTSDI